MPISPQDSSWEQLGKAIRDRRDDLGMTQSQAARAAGLSLNGWCRAELGHRIRWSTLENVEKALRWRPGTGLAVLRGDGDALQLGDMTRDSAVLEQPSLDTRSDDGSVIALQIPLPREVARDLSQEDRARVARAAIDVGQATADAMAHARRSARNIASARL